MGRMGIHCNAKPEDSQVDLDTFFEYNLRTATLPESEDGGVGGAKDGRIAPLKINMEDNHGSLEDHVPFQMGDL